MQDEILSRAKLLNDALKNSIRALMESTTNTKIRDGSSNYFNELKQKVDKTITTHYSPVKAKSHEVSSNENASEDRLSIERGPMGREDGLLRISDEENTESDSDIDDTEETRDPKSKAKVTMSPGNVKKDKELLLTKIHKQNTNIEHLQAQVRRLQMQNNVLADQNSIMRQKLNLRLQVLNVESKSMETEKSGSKDIASLRARLVATSNENSHLQALNLQLSQEKAQRQARFGELQQKYKTALAISRHQCLDLKLKLEACLEINRFQNNVITKLQSTRGDSAFCARAQEDDSTTELINGLKMTDGTTTELLEGRLIEEDVDPYAMFGKRYMKPSARFRAAVIALRFIARVRNQVGTKNGWMQNLNV